MGVRWIYLVGFPGFKVFYNDINFDFILILCCVVSGSSHAQSVPLDHKVEQQQRQGGVAKDEALKVKGEPSFEPSFK